MNEFLQMVHFFETQKIENFIEALSKEPDPNDPMVQDEIAYRLGLDLGTLSKWDKEIIGREVAKRWSWAN